MRRLYLPGYAVRPRSREVTRQVFSSPLRLLPVMVGSLSSQALAQYKPRTISSSSSYSSASESPRSSSSSSCARCTRGAVNLAPSSACSSSSSSRSSISSSSSCWSFASSKIFLDVLGSRMTLRGIVSPHGDGSYARNRYLACHLVLVGSLRLSPLAWMR